jgi:hypothetical protein
MRKVGFKFNVSDQRYSPKQPFTSTQYRPGELDVSADKQANYYQL